MQRLLEFIIVEGGRAGRHKVVDSGLYRCYRQPEVTRGSGRDEGVITYYNGVVFDYSLELINIILKRLAF